MRAHCLCWCYPICRHAPRVFQVTLVHNQVYRYVSIFPICHIFLTVKSSLAVPSLSFSLISSSVTLGRLSPIRHFWLFIPKSSYVFPIRFFSLDLRVRSAPIYAPRQSTMSVGATAPFIVFFGAISRYPSGFGYLSLESVPFRFYGCFLPSILSLKFSLRSSPLWCYSFGMCYIPTRSACLVSPTRR